MSQAQSAHSVNDKEPVEIGSLSMNSEGIIIPFEAFRSMADAGAVAEIERMKKLLSEAQRKLKEQADTIKSQKETLGDMSVEKHEIQKENERLYHELNEGGGDVTHPNNDFILSIDNRVFRDANGKNPSNEWVASFWKYMFEFVKKKDDNGQYIITCADHLAPVYMVMSSSTNMPYRFVGSRVDFAFYWNSNVVERLDDKKRAQKLTCKCKSLNTTLSGDCWKTVDITSWCRLSKSNVDNQDKYNRAWKIKEGIEKFANQNLSFAI